ncbi:MAG: hypothetical protein J07HQW1_02506 [Haloquadratum walsbyi J07HQW1]|jgi:hypothetical protein|uniref:Uncharacterized protein n=1 Tax=Haloquadratum walsbyi J07HQW1 TaxID=1238424 RepID=U1PFR6_9EURY|nr:MAG: hypothetical protein J07HQW1_02506 [Haloquadratum walsbyi J07HQW1]
MTGIVDQHLLVEDQQPETNYITNGKDEPIQIENQCRKWLRGDRAALEWVPEDVRPILVQDRGGDDPTPGDILLTEAERTVLEANISRTAGGVFSRVRLILRKEFFMMFIFCVSMN